MSKTSREPSSQNHQSNIYIHSFLNKVKDVSTMRTSRSRSRNIWLMTEALLRFLPYIDGSHCPGNAKYFIDLKDGFRYQKEQIIIANDITEPLNTTPIPHSPSVQKRYHTSQKWVPELPRRFSR